MLRALLIIILIVVLLIALDFVLASFRTGLIGIPISVMLLLVLFRWRDMRRPALRRSDEKG